MKKQKFYQHQLRLIHKELIQYIKCKRNKEQEKRHIANLLRKKYSKELQERKHQLKLIHKELKLVIKTNQQKEEELNRIRNQTKKENTYLDSKLKFNSMISNLSSIDETCSNLQHSFNQTSKKQYNLFSIKLSSLLYSPLTIDRVGCILRYKKNNTFYYILNKSNRNYLSDFGGGIKKNEHWKNGFYRELEEEGPWMKEYIETYIETEINTFSFLKTSKTRKRKTEVNQLLILIDLYKEPEFISTFYKTHEVEELYILNSSQLLYTFNYEYRLNYGLLQLKKIVLNDMLNIN